MHTSIEIARDLLFLLFSIHMGLIIIYLFCRDSIWLAHLWMMLSLHISSCWFSEQQNVKHFRFYWFQFYKIIWSKILWNFICIISALLRNVIKNHINLPNWHWCLALFYFSVRILNVLLKEKFILCSSYVSEIHSSLVRSDCSLFYSNIYFLLLQYLCCLIENFIAHQFIYDCVHFYILANPFYHK